MNSPGREREGEQATGRRSADHLAAVDASVADVLGMELDDDGRVGRLSLHPDHGARRRDVTAAAAGRTLAAAGGGRRRHDGVEARRAVLAEGRAAVAGARDEGVRAAGELVAEARVADRREAPEAARVLLVPRHARQPPQRVPEPAPEPVKLIS